MILKLSLQKYRLIYLCFVLLLFGCTSNKDKDFKQVSAHTQFKIVSFTSNSNIIEEGDLIEFKSIYLANNKDTLQQDSATYNELFNDTITYSTAQASELMKVLGSLQEGDSCVARFYATNKFSERLEKNKKALNKSDTIYAYIKIKHVYKGKEKLAYHLEENAIARFISFSKDTWQATENGVFYRIIKPSKEEKLKFNDSIKLVYKGYFLNGQVFDAYADINPYFEHVVGTQNQLISGMEIAIKYMSYGSEAEFIFPSSLAFGAHGSSTGIVPAYKAVLYKVKILDKDIL